MNTAQTIEFHATRIVIDWEWTQCADGEMRKYSYVVAVADVGDWVCEKRFASGEHWEPAVQRAVDAAMAEFDIPPSSVIDMRD